MGQVRESNQVRESEKLLKDAHPIEDFYSPHSRFIVGKYLLVDDILPEKYRTGTGWTLDGAYEHRHRKESPWRLIESLGLIDKLFIEKLLDELKKKDGMVTWIMQRYFTLIDTFSKARSTLKAEKNYSGADTIRDAFSSIGIKLQDTKEGTIISGI